MDVPERKRKRRGPYKKYLLHTEENLDDLTLGDTFDDDLTLVFEENLEDLKLLGKYKNHIKARELRTIIEKATREKNVGYHLVLKLMPVLFSTEEMASSRGQGLRPSKQGDTRPSLNANKLQAIKGFSWDYCEKHQLELATDRFMNSAITEVVSYSRKKMKKLTNDKMNSETHV